MTEIIGRHKEKLELEDAFNSRNAEFIAVYGRRRVGKTYLIRNYFRAKKCVYFQLTGIYQGTLKQQLLQFSKEVGPTFYSGATIKQPDTWMSAFEELNKAIENVPKTTKIVIFLDELPWLASRKSGVISALEFYWNRFWVNDKRIKLITCGSAAAWIIKKIIKNKGGLHNRITRKIRLLPFNLKETALYLNYRGYECNQVQVLKLYMAMGGVPFYLNQIKKNLSVNQNIDHLFFNPEGLLFDEFDEIFSSLFENAEQYKELITIIGKYKDGIARSVLEDKNKLTGQGGRLSHRLDDLEDAGFIVSYIPYGHKKIGMVYRINDEYSYFYLKWIESIKKQIKQSKAQKYWEKNTKTPEYYGWLGYAFENICYKHIDQIKQALDIDAANFASPWRYVPRKNKNDQGTQIDLVIEHSDDAISICEIKFTDKPYSIDKAYANVLSNKIEIFKRATRSNKQIFLTLISANGLSETNYSAMVDSLITLNDLFA